MNIVFYQNRERQSLADSSIQARSLQSESNKSAVRRINLKKANVARSETIRDINRQIVLNYVRERAPISRAEISQETALQRSTVSLIVDELKHKGLVDEVEGQSTGGRPPILLRLRTSFPIAVGVDVGTELTVVATSDLAGRFLSDKSFARIRFESDACRNRKVRSALH